MARAQIAHPAEQPMQRGLVDDRAMERCRAVAFLPEAEAVKPGGPSGVEVPLRRLS
jgi:hypothetical protein